MEDKYDKINSTERSKIHTENDKEREKYDDIIQADVKSESAIFEIIKVKEYSEILKNIMKSIDNYNQDLDTLDDYPYFRGINRIYLVQNTCKFIPKLNIPSEIFSERQLRDVGIH
jgi:hypothetical protein